MSPGTTRTFVAVFPPTDVAARIGAALDLLRSPNDGIAWVRASNLHYTMRFLGDLDAVSVEAARRAVFAAASARGVAPFTVRLGRPGAFPSPARPRILWLGAVEGAAPLATLAGALDTALSAERFPRPERPFTPHLTTARVRDNDGRSSDAARTAAERFLAMDPPEAQFQVDALVLVASTLAAGGSRYEPLERVRLGG